mgnify:CR=1 FL=1
MTKETQIILAIAISISLVINSVLIFWESSRRPAEDYLIINQQYYDAKGICLKGGGNWIEFDGRDGCVFSKQD